MVKPGRVPKPLWVVRPCIGLLVCHEFQVVPGIAPSPRKGQFDHAARGAEQYMGHDSGDRRG